jgi:succinoglycan biosynthesis transport protein ExoP
LTSYLESPLRGGASRVEDTYVRLLLKSSLYVFRRRRLFIVAFICVITVPGALFIRGLPNLFTSTVLLLVGYEAQTVANFKDVLEKRDSQVESLNTEMQIIRSRELATDVIQKLNLQQDPEFNPFLGREAGTDCPLAWIGDYVPMEVAPGLMAWVCRGLSALTTTADPCLMSSVGQDARPGSDGSGATHETCIEREAAVVMDRFSSRLDVSLIKESRAVSVAFTSLDAEKSAQIAGAVASTYLATQVEEKVGAAEKATMWLKEKISELRENVDESERAAELYKKEHAQRDISERLKSMTAQHLAAIAVKREAQSRLQQLQTFIGSEGVAAASGIIDYSPLRSLRAKEADLQGQLAQLSQEFGERHPQMVAVRAALRSLKGEMASEVNKTLERYETEVRTAEGNEQGIRHNLEDLGDAADLAATRLRELEREADANKQMLQRLLVRYNETSAQTDVNVNLPQARIISQANIPLGPSWPPRALFIVGLLGSSTLIGGGIAFAFERLRPGFSSRGELHAFTGLRVLGLFPAVARKDLRSKSPTSYILAHPRSILATTMRSISVNIFFHGHNKETKSLLITSSTSAEGKSTLAASLAIMGASSGKRVVLVDADLRQPFMHKWANISQTPGVAEYVLGSENLVKVLHRNRSSGVYVIPAGLVEGDPAVVLSSPKIAGLLDVLRKQFDIVVVDSPPVMMASESMVMATQVDMTVLVVRSGKTKRDVVECSLNQLLAVGANVGGTVLSLVNARDYALYSYGDSDGFSSGAKLYYNKQEETLPQIVETGIDVLRLTRKL